MLKFITVNEASSLINESPHYIRRLIHANKVKRRQRDGMYFIEKDSLEIFINERNIHREKMKAIRFNSNLQLRNNSRIHKTAELPQDLEVFTQKPNENIPKLMELIEDSLGGDLITYVSLFGKSNSMMVPEDGMNLDNLLCSMKTRFKGEGDKKFKKILLFISSPGGILEAAVKFVDIIKQYSETYEVIVPYMAKSAASLICLSADKIHMTTIAELGPIDPIIENPTKPGNMVPAKAIDEFIKYYSDIATAGGPISDVLIKIMENNIDPYILGSWKSALNYSQKEVRDALKGKINDELLDNVVNSFTSDNVSHSHPITYKMLKDMGVSAVDLIDDGELLGNIKKLFNGFNGYIIKNNAVKMVGNRENKYFTLA